MAENRKMSEEKVKELATGFIYLGIEAKEMGLIDEIGGKKEALKYIEQKLNITAHPVEYKESKTFLKEMTGMTSEGFYNIGKGIGSMFTTETEVTLT